MDWIKKTVVTVKNTTNKVISKVKSSVRVGLTIGKTVLKGAAENGKNFIKKTSRKVTEVLFDIFLPKDAKDIYKNMLDKMLNATKSTKSTNSTNLSNYF